MAHPSLQLWYEFASTYSYLAVARIEAVAEAAGVDVEWKPFLLGPILREQGMTDSPFNLHPAKGRYMWRDMERLCEGHGLPFRRPSEFPRNGLLAARVALVALREGFGPAFSRSVYHANFAEDRDIADPTIVAELVEAQGGRAEPVLSAAGSPEIKEQLRENTREASAAGVFGAPSLRVGGELYWGNDRLGEAIACAALGSP
ncbi:MAG: 2-hydroxychromene-2-carboxylate isomerase [Deltaproteobacteria bacterium]|jgi:2-hydroxychromene-2-carboxylate isomerase|nr:2-hydroxychromene-2-carboxylate isomerase [Deltaproteobacteria bacterium]